MLSWSIDLGNSRMKVGLFAGRTLLKSYSFDNSQFSNEEEFWETLPEKAIVSSVLSEESTASLLQKLGNSGVAVSHLQQETALPFSNAYQSKATQGNDRISAVAGAQVYFPDKDILVIDCGTCITFDFLSKEGKYLGGAISPGVRMRLQAMNKFTSKLPLKEWRQQDEVDLIGNSTENSLLSGAVNGSIAEVDGIINRYLAAFPELKTVLTGGDSSFFEKKLKNTIFADPNLVLKGLNEILLYNSENS